MILTEKTKNDFLNEFPGTVPVNEIELYAHIINWFDSKNFFINIKSKFGQRKQCERFSFTIRQYNSGFLFNSRIEAAKEAISKVDYFYNQSCSQDDR